MTERMISLTVGTKSAEEWFTTFQEISELAGNLGAAHDYVSVSSVVPGELQEDVIDESLYYDDQTIQKVHDAITGGGLSSHTAADVITYIQNAGILFRERIPS